MKELHPLRGRRIVITRNRSAVSRLSGRLTELGAEVIALPLIEIHPDCDPVRCADVFQEFGSYEWIVFTSRNGVHHFFTRFLKEFHDLRSIGFIRIAAIGGGTADALGEFHLKPDLIPGESVAEGLVDALKEEQTLDNLRVLLITGNLNRPELSDGLAKAGAIVDELRVYRTVFTSLDDSKEAKAFRERGADALVFASSSAVRAFGEQAKHLQLKKGAKIPALCSFGPVTSATMRKAGIPVAVESTAPDSGTLADCLVEYFRNEEAKG